jgi:hypothetical protein
MEKEMKNLNGAFEFQEPDASAPLFHKYIVLYMIFDVKWTFHASVDWLPKGT